jgi:divalent metal cation (Fe/Co/Zn/Cd) transporter
VVILGLVFVGVGKFFPNMAFLSKADAVAALGVAIIVVYISIELGIRTVTALLDTAPKGVAERVKLTVEAVPGVLDCHHIRVRPSGPSTFIDVHVLVEGSWTLEHAHVLTEQVEQAIHRVISAADVTVHPEPIHHNKGS